jgi:hypothetical protein
MIERSSIGIVERRSEVVIIGAYVVEAVALDGILGFGDGDGDGEGRCCTYPTGSGVRIR